MEPNALKGERFNLDHREYGLCKSSSFIPQQPELTADLAAICVHGEQLVQPSCTQEIAGHIKTKMEIVIALFGCWDKCLILPYYPSRFSFLSVLTLLRTSKLRQA